MPTKTYATVISLDDGTVTPEVDDMIVGMRFDYAGAAAPPKSLQCNGQAVSRVTYAALFAAIGTTWGPGDGLTTFNLPDDRDRHVRGKGAGTAVGQAVGSDTHALSAAELPVVAGHTHGAGPLGHAGGDAFVQLIDPAAPFHILNGDGDQGVAPSGSTDTAGGFGGGAAHPNIPASNIYLPCIYAGV